MKGAIIIMPVNPEAIGVFGLFATVICFGLEQVGVGITKNTDHEKLHRSLGYVALFLGSFCQLFTGIWMFLFGIAGDHSKYLGNVFTFFGLFWLVVAFFFLKGGDKKVIAHFFVCGLAIVLLFTIHAFEIGLVWPLGIDLAVIDLLLVTLIFGWYTEKPALTKFAGICNLTIGVISFFLLYPHILGLH